MPNIIEQQDLLKGLPDTRLAMLLQNPMGDIPPFLVAAEAQRRQAIRQQFAGSEGKESVVDTLTKQLANVPQNIGSKSSPTEAPDLKGILEKSEEIQDQISSQQEKDAGQSMASGGVVRRFAEGGIANLAPKGTYYGFTPGVPTETALGSLARASSVIPRTMGVMPGNIGYQARPTQPQGMRAGGMVQRYQSQGLVERMGSQYGSRYPTMQELARMTPEELAALRKFQSDQSMQRLNQRAQITGGKFGQGLAYQRELLENRLEGPFAEFASPESAVEAAKRLQDLPTEEEMTQTLEANRPLPSTVRPRTFPTLPPGASGGMSLTTPPKAAAAPVETPPPEPGETQDEYRARLEKLLAAQQPSDWEKAQGYFAMAEQFLDPSKTTMQSLVGAGQAFAQSAGEQARAQREADLARERGLLEYDISQSEGKRDREEKKLQSQISSLQYQGEQAMKTAELHDRIVREAERELADYQKSLVENELLTPEQRANDPGLVALKQRIKDANAAKNAALAASAMFQRKYGETYGTYSKTPYWDGEKLVYPQ